jgi:hypothetical protein
MPQQGGDSHQVNPSIQAVLTKAVAQRVGCHLLQPCLIGVLPNDLLHSQGSQPIATLTDEQLGDTQLGSNLKISLESLANVQVQGDHPVLGSLARADHQLALALGQADVTCLQGAELTHTDPCMPQDREDS